MSWTLKSTPAVASGLTDHLWTLQELLERAATAAQNGGREKKNWPSLARHILAFPTLAAGVFMASAMLG